MNRWKILNKMDQEIEYSFVEGTPKKYYENAEYDLTDQFFLPFLFILYKLAAKFGSFMGRIHNKTVLRNETKEEKP